LEPTPPGVAHAFGGRRVRLNRTVRGDWSASSSEMPESEIDVAELSPFEDDGMGRYRASRMFMGAAAVGRHGVMQSDVILAQAERRLLERADELVLLVDSSKFEAPTGHVICTLDEVDIVVTDRNIRDEHARMLEQAGVRLIMAGLED